MTSNEAREAFLKFFEDRGHRRVQSSSLIPKDDPTLLFTNAGMNQFKDVFLGIDSRDYARAVSSQKCMRVSGKHNDLETVGRTPRHHTFFEMLGNFSFGDYFKKEAIEFAWELCTRIYRLNEERLIVTVFQDDEEAYDLWSRHIGISQQRLVRCGEEENFWAMGETGPCGPCSEIHYDMGDRLGDSDSPFGADSDRFVEIWNLVFMQFNRSATGEMTPLPSPSIDTGMGLERISCILQGVASNYETDLFRPLIQEAESLTGVRYGRSESADVSLRILADHSRAAMFLISDGIVPGNEGRGYVLRKILRRAIRHGKMLGKEEPFLFSMAALVAELMKKAFPDLEKSREYAARIVRSEEERFGATLAHGTTLLDEIFAKLDQTGVRRVSGEDLFRLYDTFGFPLDLAREICQERGFELDEKGFEEALEKQRQRARASWKGAERTVPAAYAELSRKGLETEFTGYEDLADVEGQVLALLCDQEPVDQLSEGQTGEMVLSRTPFYAEAGGQVADTGLMANAGAHAEVEDVFSPTGALQLHRVRVLKGSLRVGDAVRSTVSRSRRRWTESNHTATHLLHAALRQLLGEHVKQAGSLVAPDRLRFDFTHFQPLSPSELRELEETVNSKIQENLPVEWEIRNLDDAIREGAMALFGEKYRDRVRVVRIPGFSLELCGGTHVDRTGDVGVFKIVGEGSISAGVRRLEAVTSQKAVQRMIEDDRILHQLTRELRVGRDQLSEAIEKMSRELKDAQRKAAELELQLAKGRSGDVESEAQRIAGVNVLARRVENLDRNGLRRLA
ncbi:MAG TPA: alanine--tRNA ligase, partial [Acidobacteriota bacterium]|nr:alanine--tRNA ligase [Acidobacteriota bacterium]